MKRLRVIPSCHQTPTYEPFREYGQTISTRKLFLHFISTMQHNAYDSLLCTEKNLFRLLTSQNSEEQELEKASLLSYYKELSQAMSDDGPFFLGSKFSFLVKN